MFFNVKAAVSLMCLVTGPSFSSWQKIKRQGDMRGGAHEGGGHEGRANEPDGPSRYSQ